MNYTKKDHEEWLGEVGIPFDDMKSNGGRIPDHCHYGKWLRRNDPIAFQVSYNERANNLEYAERMRRPTDPRLVTTLPDEAP